MRIKKSVNGTLARETIQDATAQDHHFIKSDLQEKIAKKAYELYMKRGCEPGSHLDDWLAAEKEITAKKPRVKRSVSRI